MLERGMNVKNFCGRLGLCIKLILLVEKLPINLRNVRRT
jgi:hypothetical protein